MVRKNTPVDAGVFGVNDWTRMNTDFIIYLHCRLFGAGYNGMGRG
jgi:hypothetical protein